MYSIKKNILLVFGLWIIIPLTLPAAPIRIMPLGDSITEGVMEIPLNPDQNSSIYPLLPNGESNLTAKQDRIAYRGKLWDLLKDEGYEVDFVGSKRSGENYTTNGFDIDHEGHGGETSNYIKEHINDWLTTNPADIILLHIGTNDGGLSVPIATSVANVQAILDTIFTKNSNTKVFVARIIEARRAHQNSGGINGRLWKTKEFNDAIEDMITNHLQNANIRVVNMESGAELEYAVAGFPYDMQPYHNDENIPDFHPNKNGFEKMAEKWFTMILDSGWLLGKQENDWFNYDNETKNAKVGPKKSESELKAEGLNVKFEVGKDDVTLNYANQAYIKATSDGKVTTKFQVDGSDNSTLKANTFYVTGTKSVIKKLDDEIIIETSVKLEKGSFIVMGNK